MLAATIQDETAKLQEYMQRMISGRRGEKKGTIPGCQAHIFLLSWLQSITAPANEWCEKVSTQFL